MRIDSHAVGPEELMAYLDGELTVENATRVSTHLIECHECQAAAADLHGLSERLREWTVETPDIALPAARIRRQSHVAWPMRFVWAAVAVAIVGFLVAPGTVHYRRELTQLNERRQRASLKLNDMLIARSSSLTFRAHDFDQVRDAINKILVVHNGYVSQMTINAPQSAPRTIDGTLRVPSTDLDATLAALETLGVVQSETRTGEEVTRESMDLDARLANARNAEQRLTTLLKDRTGKLSDVLAVEEKINATRLEIETMEAARKKLTNRIDFATIDLHVTEESKAQLEGVRTPVLTRLRNSAVAGAAAVSDSLIGTAAFLLTSGPVLLVWFAILFFPARFVYRHLQNKYPVRNSARGGLPKQEDDQGS